MTQGTGEAVRPVTREYHHGRTPAAWTGSIIAGVAFVLAAIAFMTGPNWTLLWTSIVLLVLSLVAGGVLKRMGYGQS